MEFGLDASCLKDIFESVDNQNIIDFINDAHFVSSVVVFVTHILL